MYRIPVIDMVRTGANMARIRADAGITVRELQNIFGFATPQAIYKWQQGRALPTLDNFVIFADVCHVRIDDVIVFQDDAAHTKTA